MRTTTIIAIATMLATGSAFGQSAETTTGAGAAARPAAPAAHAIKPAAASTPESRSAAALALSHEPTFDEGTAARIKEAALSYGDLAVRGGGRRSQPTPNSYPAWPVRTTICCASA